MNEKRNYFGIVIPYSYMRNMTTGGAINLINGLASVYDNGDYLLTYRDKTTHNCILCFRKENGEPK